jgi:hypothetical protein
VQMPTAPGPCAPAIFTSDAVWESAVADGAASPDLRCPFELDCDSTGERERRSYRVWPRKCLLVPGPAEPMTDIGGPPDRRPFLSRFGY